MNLADSNMTDEYLQLTRRQLLAAGAGVAVADAASAPRAAEGLC